MAHGTDTPAETRAEPGLATTIALYTVARIALVAVIAAVLAAVGVPVLLAILVALVVALPLSMLVFRGLRGRLDRALAAARERRGTERAALRAGLRGDASEGGTEPEADGGQDGPREQ
jgi:Flp pilus assembly protein TadB